MSGNEILLNLDNCENLRNTELVGGLIALSNKDRNREFDWNNHPITAKCLKEIYKRIAILNAKNVLHVAIAL